MSPPSAKARRRFRLRSQGTNISVLALIWVMLNGDVQPLTLLAAVLLAVLVTWAFPLPPIQWGGRVRPLGVLVLVTRVLVDLAVASFRLAVRAFSPRPHPRTAVIAVQLNSDADLYQVGTGSLLSIVPGSVVVDARRRTRTLYLHLFDTSPDHLDQVRARALRVEARVLGAFASSQELREADERRRVR